MKLRPRAPPRSALTPDTAPVGGAPRPIRRLARCRVSIPRYEVRGPTTFFEVRERREQGTAAAAVSLGQSRRCRGQNSLVELAPALVQRVQRGSKRPREARNAQWALIQRAEVVPNCEICTTTAGSTPADPTLREAAEGCPCQPHDTDPRCALAGWGQPRGSDGSLAFVSPCSA